MTGSLKFVRNPSKKVLLEQKAHACPKCKHAESVMLTRSERQWILFNQCVSNMVRVQYECSRCSWKNQELPFDLSEPLDDFYYESSDSLHRWLLCNSDL